MNIVYYHNVGVDLDSIDPVFLSEQSKREIVDNLWFSVPSEFSHIPDFFGHFYYNERRYPGFWHDFVGGYGPGLSNREIAFLVQQCFGVK